MACLGWWSFRSKELVGVGATKGQDMISTVHTLHSLHATLITLMGNFERLFYTWRRTRLCFSSRWSGREECLDCCARVRQELEPQFEMTYGVDIAREETRWSMINLFHLCRPACACPRGQSFMPVVFSRETLFTVSKSLRSHERSYRLCQVGV